MIHSSAQHQTVVPASAVRPKFGLRVPLRDGEVLSGIAYLPRDAAGPVPAIVEINPYSSDMRHHDAVYYASRGFAFVVVDALGRADSEGTYAPFMRDGQDGYDTIQWIAGQEWCDGRIALHGSSYTGWNQWRILGELPPALRGIVPAGAPLGGLDYPRGGVPNLYGNIIYPAATYGRAAHWDLFRETGMWHDLLADAWRAHEPEESLRARLGYPPDPTAALAEQIFPGSPLLTFLVPSPEALAQADVAVLSITGLYDDSQLGAVHHHEQFVAHASESAKARSHLLFGPWDHYGTETGEPRAGELTFAPQAGVDLRALRAEWYGWVLRGEPKPAFLTDPVLYYQTGSEEWHGAASLAEASGPVRPLFLTGAGGDGRLDHAGRLATEPASGPEFGFVADPDDDHTIRLEVLARPDEYPDVPSVPKTFNSLFLTSAGHDPTNGVFATDLGREGVVYHTDPLVAPLRLVGRPELRLRLRLDVVDADLMVLLHEVRSDGSMVFLSSELLRLRYRSIPEFPAFVEPDEPLDLDLTRFRYVTRTLAEGSRLRLTVRSANSVVLGKNPHTGKPLGADAPRSAHIRLLHDEAHPSVLKLPIVD